jgi:Spy/CpxP family protein refolding chaperone
MKLNWKTLGAAIAGVGVIILMTAMLVVSQGPAGQGPGRGGPPRGGFPGGPGGPRDGLGPLGRDLNLTDEQKAQIKAIHESFEASTKDLHEQLRALHESEPNPFTTAFDEVTVRAAAEARARIDVELQVAHAKMMSQIGAVLTSEQKAQVAARRPPFPPGPPPPER